MRLSAGVFLGILAGISARGQTTALILPTEVKMGQCQNPGPGSEDTDPRVTIVARTTSGAAPVSGFPDPKGFLRAPVAGVASPEGVELEFTADIQRMSKGRQRTWVAFAFQGSTDVAGIVSVLVDCIPESSLKIPSPFDRLDVTLTAGSTAQSYSVPIQGGDPSGTGRNLIPFQASSETPDVNPSWLSAPRSGSVPNGGESSLTVRVDAGNLTSRTQPYAGYVHVRDEQAQVGSADVLVTLTVQPGAAPVQNPSIPDGGIRNGASKVGPVAPGAWAAIMGTNLAPDTAAGRTWRESEIVNGVLPTAMDGVRVSIDGKAAAVYYVSNNQINFQVPSNVSTGSNVAVVVTTSKGSSDPVAATVQTFAPVFFPDYATGYVIAQHAADYSLVGRGSRVPARPGEVIILYGTGFGPTDPETPSGIFVTRVARVVQPVTIRIAGVSANTAAYLIGAGLYQFNVTVPNTLPDGDHQIVAEIAGAQSDAGLVLPVRR